MISGHMTNAQVTWGLICNALHRCSLSQNIGVVITSVTVMTEAQVGAAAELFKTGSVPAVQPSCLSRLAMADSHLSKSPQG